MLYILREILQVYFALFISHIALFSFEMMFQNLSLI